MKRYFRAFWKAEDRLCWLSEDCISVSTKYGFREEIGEYAFSFPRRKRSYPLDGRKALKLLESHPKAYLINLLSDVARRAGGNLFLVGGALRDLLISERIYREPDLLYEGDIDLFLKFAFEKGFLLKERTPFLTFKLGFENGEVVDIAVCRKETYDAPGALPRVFRASLAEDLERRDFTINSMALGLTGSLRGVLYDPFFGLDDLGSGILRALKPYSFLEDPTRIIRAIRLKARFSLKFEEMTLRTLKLSLRKGALKWAGWVRVWKELEELFKEEKALDGIFLMEELGCWDNIGVELGEIEKSILRKIATEGMDPDLDRVEFLLLVLFGSDPNKDGARWGELFQLPKRMKRSLSLASLWRKINLMDFREKYEVLRKAEKSVVRLWSLCLDEDWISIWESYNKAKPLLSEEEIERVSFGKGPEYGRIKMEILRLQLEEGLRDKNEILKRLKERSV